MLGTWAVPAMTALRAPLMPRRLMSLPFAALPGYIEKIKAGTNIERPTEQLISEREQLVADYRELLETDEDRATYDQLIGLAHRVFPYVEGHKFYCEHWYTNLFFNKIREFGTLLMEHGFFGPDGREEDVFHLTQYELESAIVSHPKVAEAAVVGRPDPVTGTAIVAFVTPRSQTELGGDFKNEVRSHVARAIGPIAKPADVHLTDSLPKTRSGKIMRRLLRDIASGKETVGDTTTLEDYSVLARLRETEEA